MLDVWDTPMRLRRIRLGVAAIALRYAACRGRTLCTHGYDYGAFQALAYPPSAHTARIIHTLHQKRVGENAPFVL